MILVLLCMTSIILIKLDIVHINNTNFQIPYIKYIMFNVVQLPHYI